MADVNKYLAIQQEWNQMIGNDALQPWEVKASRDFFIAQEPADQENMIKVIENNIEHFRKTKLSVGV